jgi:hypothetical protein
MHVVASSNGSRDGGSGSCARGRGAVRSSPPPWQARRRTRTGGSSSRQVLHGYEVIVESSRGREQVALSDFHLSRENVFRRTVPMAREVPEALGVPLERKA